MISFYVKQGTATSWRIHVHNIQTDTYIIRESGTATAAYVQHSLPLSIPSGCTSVRVILQHMAAAAAGTTVLFDDIVFRRSNVPPKAILKWSDDGGKTWSNELTQSIGKRGDYKTEVNFRRLGASKRRIYRNTVSDPVEVVCTGVDLK